MMRVLFLIIYSLCIGVTQAAADTVIVANAKSPIERLSLSEATEIYLGRERRTQAGHLVLPLDHPVSSELRARFFYELSGRPINQVNAYLARQLFSGQASPPLQMPDARAVIDMVKSNTSAIAYLEADPKDRDLRVVLRLTSPR